MDTERSVRSASIQESEWVSPPPFDKLYDKFKDAVFCFAYYLTHDRREAEDLFQEVWLRIIRSLPEKVNMQSLKTWIFTVVANIHRDNLRKMRSRRIFFRKSKYSRNTDELFSKMPGVSLPDSTNQTDSSDMRRDIAQAIACLPDRQRRVFVLKEVAGFKQTEVSDILGIPLGTVKSIMHRAVRRLRRELSAYNPNKERIKCDAKTYRL